MDTRAILKQSLRSIGALDPGVEPTAQQLNDGLDAFNSFYLSLFGAEIGPRLEPVVLSASTSAVYGARYQCGLTAPATLTLPDSPKDGWRTGFADVKANFATYNLTVNPNGRLINGAAGNLTITTSGAAKTYLYRSDTGWSEEAALALTDTPILPVEFHAALSDAFALFLHPQYWDATQLPSPGLASAAQRGKDLLTARYGVRQPLKRPARK